MSTTGRRRKSWAEQVEKALQRSDREARREARRKVVPDPTIDISTTESVERFDIPARGRPKNVTPERGAE